MRIVVDTNIFLGACLGTGSASAVISACLRGQAVPLMGNALFNEYEDVFARTELFSQSLLDHEERSELLDIFLSVCEWTRIYYGWRPNLPNEGDNHLVELAVAGSAKYIVTRNLRDVSRMKLNFPNLAVLTPEAFLKELHL
jgi:putative PIN family toxin of toxin-antitoxin system